MARWRSGNASVCKTDMRGFNSRPCLTGEIRLRVFRRELKTAAMSREYARPRGAACDRGEWRRTESCRQSRPCLNKNVAEVMKW